MNAEQIPEVVQKVRNRLVEIRRERGIDLELEERDYQIEDDWLYLCVAPAKPGIRASDYAEVMAEIEKELRNEQIKQVLLVPTIED